MRWFWAACAAGVCVGMTQIGKAQADCGTTYEYGWKAIRDNPFGNCSAKGLCLDTGVCQCEQPWTGLSDIVNTQGEDCQINNVVIQSLWGFNLLVLLKTMVHATPRFVARYRQHRENAKAVEGSGRKIRLIDNSGLMATLLFSCMVAPGLLTLGILRIADPTQRIGVTWPMTIAFTFTRVGFYAMTYKFQPALLSSLLRGKQARQMQFLVIFAQRAYLGNFFFNALINSAPIYLLVVGDPTLEQQLLVWYIVQGGITVQLLYQLVLSVYIKKKITRMLDRSYLMTKSERILEMKKALISLQNNVIRQSTIQSIIYLSFCLWPFLYNKSDYWLPIGLCAYSIIGKNLADTTIRSKGDTSDTSKASKNASSAPGDPSDSKGSDAHETSVVVASTRGFGEEGNTSFYNNGTIPRPSKKATAKFEEYASQYQNEDARDDLPDGDDEYV